MKKRTLIPTKKQYENWSIPSKVTYIAAVLAIIGIILSIVFYIVPAPELFIDEEPLVINDSIFPQKDYHRIDTDSAP